MASYGPAYDHSYGYPPPPGAMPPPPRGPPPSYDQYRGPDSYVPPQGGFSFRSNGIPQYPQAYKQENHYARRRNQRGDNANLNQGRRRPDYKPRAAYRAAPADRPLLRHHDEANSSEQMLGMVNGQKFMAAEDISDSEEEEMVESESEAGQDEDNTIEPSSMAISTGDGQVDEEPQEPAPKRRALASISQNSKDAASEPKWSNPDPYTVLPPVDEQRKRKDVVKLIRKSRKEAEESVNVLNQVAANDDFISFGMEDDGVAVPDSPSMDRQDNVGDGALGAPIAPRSFSHLQNLHGQQPPLPELSDQPAPISSVGFPPVSVQNGIMVPEELVLDTTINPSNSRSKFDFTGDEALGNRKRTRNDNIKGNKNGAGHINGSILYEWFPLPNTNPTPWLRRTNMITVNAGFRLHKEICDFYDYVKPQHFEQTVRQDLLSRLQAIVTAEIPHASVVCFGSFAAGMYLPNADMDVVVVSSSFRLRGDKVICQNRSQIYRFADFVRSSRLGTSVETIAGARVPLVKFVDRITGIRVDVSFENDTGIIANDTFAGWKRQYPAMPVLVTVIKQFLMMRGMNEVVHGGLGGFSVTCLVTSLLQNMPRVQTGELVPEEHLGEILIEFLDFYGNRLDTSRTGIMMKPPGYFKKQAPRRPKQPSNNVYKANKTERLAIMDPNQEHNDISGGSRLVMLIFERFSHAHAEILRAMRTPSRVSLLDWLLGGNYDSFTYQRNHLRELYGDREGIQGDIFDDYQSQGIQIRGANGLRDGAPTSAAGKQDKETLSNPKANSEANSEAKSKARYELRSEAKSDAIPITNGKRRKTKDEKVAHLEKKREERSAQLKAQFPDMKGIPARVSNGQRTKLVAEYEASQQAQQPAKQLSKTDQASAQLRSKQARARALEQNYPDMPNIPDAITKKQRKRLVAAYISRDKAEVPQIAPPQVKQQVVPLVKISAHQFPFPWRPAYQDKLSQLMSNPSYQLPGRQKTAARPKSNKMAPLSDERRAEVARNLGGTSNDDPITLD